MCMVRVTVVDPSDAHQLQKKLVNALILFGQERKNKYENIVLPLYCVAAFNR